MSCCILYCFPSCCAAPLALKPPPSRSVPNFRGKNIFLFFACWCRFGLFLFRVCCVALFCVLMFYCFDVLLFCFVLLFFFIFDLFFSFAVLFICFDFLFCVRVSSAQAERLQLVLGTGKQEAEAKLLWLMIAQKDKYEKWLFRVLVVLSELLVRPVF